MAAGYKTGGRQKGARNKRTLAREAMLRRINAGLVATTPLDFILSVMTNIDLPLTIRLEAAVMAAPFVHPRLKSIVHVQKPSRESELAQLLKELDGKSRGIPSAH